MPLPSILDGTQRRCKRMLKPESRGQCPLPAIEGQDICHMHGGAAPQVKAAGKRKAELARQEARMLKLVQAESEVDPNISVQEQYQRILGTIVAWLEVCQQQVESLGAATFTTGAGDVKAHAIVTLFERSMDRAAKVLADAQHLKLDESRVRIEAVKKQRLADLWSTWVQALFKILSARLPEQKAVLDRVLRDDVPKITRDTLLGDT